jgi:hypothetical protein
MNLLKIAPQLHKPQHSRNYCVNFGAWGLALGMVLISTVVEARDSKSSKIKSSKLMASIVAGDALDKARPSYIYRAKQTDTPESIAFEFLDEAHSLDKKQQFYAHNSIDKKATRKPLAQNTPFNIPVAWMYLKPTRASVLAVSGDVTVTVQAAQNSSSSGPVKVAITSKTILDEGSRIQTTGNSFASIALPDGSILSIEPNSDIILDTLKQYASSDIFKINIVLNNGRVESEVKPLSSPESSYQIKSKRLSTGVRGTRFAVSDRTDGAGYALLEVLSGEVGASSALHGMLATPSGFGRVAQANEPSGLIDLFSKPTWVCGRNAGFSVGADVSIAASNKTQQAQLKLDVYAGRYADLKVLQALVPIKQQTVPFASNAIDLALPAGDYTLVALAINVYGLQGYRSLQTVSVINVPVPVPKQDASMTEKPHTNWVRNHQTESWVWSDQKTQDKAQDKAQDSKSKSTAQLITTAAQTRCSVN